MKAFKCLLCLLVLAVMPTVSAWHDACAQVPASQGSKRALYTRLAAKSSGPLKGWYLSKVADTYFEEGFSYARDGSAIHRMLTKAKSLFGHGSDALTRQMQSEHYDLQWDPDVPKTENERYAESGASIVSEQQRRIGQRRVEAILYESDTAMQNGQYERMVQMYTRALTIARNDYRDFPKSDGFIDGHLWRLVHGLKEKLQFARAEAVVLKILELDKRLHAAGRLKSDEYKQALAVDYMELGFCQFSQKRYADAEKNYLLAKGLREQSRGKTAPTTLRVVSHLARLYDAQNRQSEAAKMKKLAAALPACPTCGTNFDVKPIAFGLIRNDLTHLDEEYALFGCRVPKHRPKWHCARCRTKFGHQQRE